MDILCSFIQEILTKKALIKFTVGFYKKNNFYCFSGCKTNRGTKQIVYFFKIQNARTTGCHPPNSCLNPGFVAWFIIKKMNQIRYFFRYFYKSRNRPRSKNLENVFNCWTEFFYYQFMFFGISDQSIRFGMCVSGIFAISQSLSFSRKKTSVLSIIRVQVWT